MPGGRDVPYHQALQGETNARIRRFVEKGGAYLGFCAGGYYGSGAVEFDKGHPLEVTGERELAFFPGTAVGPAFGGGTFAYNNDSGARAAQISWASGSHRSTVSRVFYNGGCFFREAELFSDVEVVARYAELTGQPAAIVCCKVGAGVAVLSGVHPEYAAESFRGARGRLGAVHAEILEDEVPRMALLSALLTRAQIELSE
jgi:biotin--protein ligase